LPFSSVFGSEFDDWFEETWVLVVRNSMSSSSWEWWLSLSLTEIISSLSLWQSVLNVFLYSPN
jgi:hypothetical protein